MDSHYFRQTRVSVEATTKYKTQAYSVTKEEEAEEAYLVRGTLAEVVDFTIQTVREAALSLSMSIAESFDNIFEQVLN